MTFHQTMSICALRVSRLNAAGAPDAGNPLGAWCQQGVGTLTWSYEQIAPEVISKLDGCGNLCIYRRRDPKITAVNLRIEFCTEDYPLRDILTEQPVTGPPATPTGIITQADVACGVVAPRRGAVVEWWAEAWQCTDFVPGFPYKEFGVGKAFLTDAGRTHNNQDAPLVLEGFALINNLIGDGPFNDLPELVGVPDIVSWELDRPTLPPTCNTGAYLPLP